MRSSEEELSEAVQELDKAIDRVFTSIGRVNEGDPDNDMYASEAFEEAELIHYYLGVLKEKT